MFSACAWLAGLCLILIFLTMLAGIVLRQVHTDLPGADDITAFLCVGTAFLALAHGFRRGEQVRVTLLLTNLPPAMRRYAEALVLCLAAVAMATCTYWTINDVLLSYELDDIAQGTLPIPMWIPKLVMPMGSAMLLLAIVEALVLVLRGQEPEYLRAVRLRAENNDFSVEP
jgi:TRAP-type C4-dicarboxylate transport system permease small subunit